MYTSSPAFDGRSTGARALPYAEELARRGSQEGISNLDDDGALPRWGPDLTKHVTVSFRTATGGWMPIELEVEQESRAWWPALGERENESEGIRHRFDLVAPGDRNDDESDSMSSVRAPRGTPSNTRGAPATRASRRTSSTMASAGPALGLERDGRWANVSAVHARAVVKKCDSAAT
jgi:hypothetical protein